MDDPTAPYRDAYVATEESLQRVEGLAHALYQIALDHSDLGSSNPTSEAIVTLIALIEEKAKLAAEQHSAEWTLIVRSS